jgi:hypothetical protein
MIVTLLYKLSRTMLTVPAVVPRRESSKDAELLVLRHENPVLGSQITGPVRYEPCAARKVIVAGQRACTANA